jgi:hypothetical protein
MTRDLILKSRSMAANSESARKLGSRTLIDFKSVKKYYDALPEMVSGAKIPNAPKPRRHARAVRS